MCYIIGQLIGLFATGIIMAIPVFRKKWQMLAVTTVYSLWKYRKSSKIT